MHLILPHEAALTCFGQGPRFAIEHRLCNYSAMLTALTLVSTDLHATIDPLGARLVSLHFNEGPNLLLNAEPTLFPGWQEEYCSVLVGPVANRVTAGRVRIDGRTYQMPQNETDSNSLHSGPDGLHRRFWNVLDHKHDSLSLGCRLTDGECGLPGDRDITALYTVEGATLTLEIEVSTTAKTPISIAHHPYWRLGTAPGHRLRVYANKYLPVDAAKLPTGDIRDVEGTDFDFRQPKSVPAWIDHNLCIRDIRLSAPAPVAELTGADGTRLCIDSTETGLQVYAAAHLPDLPDSILGPGAGIALEPQGWPDAANHRNFPPVLCTPDEPYKQITRYHFDRIT